RVFLLPFSQCRSCFWHWWHWQYILEEKMLETGRTKRAMMEESPLFLVLYGKPKKCKGSKQEYSPREDWCSHFTFCKGIKPHIIIVSIGRVRLASKYVNRVVGCHHAVLVPCCGCFG